MDISILNMFSEFIGIFIKKNRDKSSAPIQSNNSKVIYIDGKPYIKVKLRLVDTFGTNTDKYIEELENIIETQEEEIRLLILSKEELRIKVDDIQKSNIGVYLDNRIRLEILEKETITLKQEIDEKDRFISELKNIIDKNNDKMLELKQKTNNLTNENRKKDNEITDLRIKVFNSTNFSKKNFYAHEENINLKKALAKSKKELLSKKIKLEEYESLISTLTKKIFDIEMKD
jgi:hypothetical protein